MWDSPEKSVLRVRNGNAESTPSTDSRHADFNESVGREDPPSAAQPDSPTRPLTNPNHTWADFSVKEGQEAQDLKMALQRSLEENSMAFPTSMSVSADRLVADVVDLRPVLQSVEEANVDETLLSLSNDFEPVHDPSGDALVYIGPPPKLPQQSNGDYAHVSSHFSQTHRLHSKDLISLGSARVKEFVGPKSVRVERRLRRDGLIGHTDLEGIKYFIDLRPPNEDDEAIILLTDLTCSHGVLLWHRAQTFFNIPKPLICGRDTFGRLADLFSLESASANPRRETLNGTTETSSEAAAEQNDSSKSVVPAKPPVSAAAKVEEPLEPEYSPLRHRSAIERLLQAIVHKNPKLDSAPKMWTYFALAKYFQVATHNRISGWITTWMLSGANINFIQCNPEVAFRVGMGIESSFITQAAFSILVGERALLDVYGEQDPTVLRSLKRSIHGRELALLDEDERNRIDHAASSLVNRIRSLFGEITLGPMSWLERCDEYRKLLDFKPRSDEEKALIAKGTSQIKDYLRGRIYWLLCRTHTENLVRRRTNMRGVNSFMPGTLDNFYTTFNDLNQPMRLFTCTFWESLIQGQFFAGPSNINDYDGNSRPENTNAWNHLSKDMRDRYEDDPEVGIKPTTSSELGQFARQFNELLAKHYEQDHPNTVQASQTLHSQPTSSEARTTISTGDMAQTSQPLDNATDDLFNFEDLTVSSPTSKWPQTRLHARESSAQKRRKLSQSEHVSIDPPISAEDKWVPDNQAEELWSTPAAAWSSGVEVRPNPAAREDLVLADIEQEFQVEREYALQLELLYVAKKRRTSNMLTEEVQNLFQQFEPVVQHRDRSGKILYTEFLDKTRPQAKYIRCYGSAGFSEYVPVSKQVFDMPLAPVDPGPSQPERAPVGEKRIVGANHPYDGPLAGFSLLSIRELLRDATNSLRRIVAPILHPAHLFQGVDPLPVDLTDVLLCLGDDEWKYLPLWVPGGCDDGTGGVFDEADVPNLEKGGFRGGKRGIHNVSGTPFASASASEDSFSEIGSEAVSTVGRASHLAAKDYDGDTVITLSTEDNEAIGQRQVWEQIQKIKTAKEQEKGKGRAQGELVSLSLPLRGANGDTQPPDGSSKLREETFDMDEEDGETSTVRHADSDIGDDIQGEMFGDMDSDPDLEFADDVDDEHFGLCRGHDTSATDSLAPTATNAPRDNTPNPPSSSSSSRRIQDPEDPDTDDSSFHLVDHKHAHAHTDSESESDWEQVPRF